MSSQNKKGGFGGGPIGGVRPGGAKAKNFKRSSKRLVGYLKPHKAKLVLIFAMAILSTIFSILSPYILGKAITKIGEGVMMKYKGVPGASIDFKYVGTIVLTLIGLYVFSSIFSYIQQYFMAGVAQNTVKKLRNDIDEKLAKLPLKYFDSHSKGDILSRVTNDLDNISTTLQQSLNQLVTSIITIIGVAIMMFTINIWLTFICLLTLPVSIFIIKPFMKKSQKFFGDQQRELGVINGHIEEYYSGHKIVKAFNREPIVIDEFNVINDKLYEAGWKAQFVSGIIMPLMNFVNNVAYVGIAVVGAIFVTKRLITLGDIQAFIQYTRQFSQPISQTANIANILQSTMASAERVFEILDENEEVLEKQNAEKLMGKGNVVFENVKFGYNDDKILITDMNIEAKPGETVAIVGPTGAGKTTLINLLMRFYDVNDGSIRVDGVDIREVSRFDLRNTFGMVLQDTWLFNGTIRDNIAYGREGATEEEIVEAAKAAHADYFIRTLSEGYNTVLNEDASNISQGQKQLLTIARAILADPRILILDEATSSVDTRTEGYIQKAMNKLMEGRTSFVIAHRLSTIKDADLILVMDKGNVIEKGTHDELIKQNGFYADLYNSQFGESA